MTMHTRYILTDAAESERDEALKLKYREGHKKRQSGMKNRKNSIDISRLKYKLNENKHRLLPISMHKNAVFVCVSEMQTKNGIDIFTLHI